MNRKNYKKVEEEEEKPQYDNIEDAFINFMSDYELSKEIAEDEINKVGNERQVDFAEENSKDGNGSIIDADLYIQWSELGKSGVAFFILAGIFMIFFGAWVQPYYFILVDVFMVLTGLFLMFISVVQWNFTLYWMLIVCSFFEIKNVAITIFDFRDFLICKSHNVCGSVWTFLCYRVYYVLCLFTVGFMIYTLRICFYILTRRNIEDNIGNTFDDKSRVGTLSDIQKDMTEDEIIDNMNSIKT